MILHHHLGLGDHFICNGLVNYLSKDESIKLICKNKNLPTIQSLYLDNTNVTVCGIDGHDEIKESAQLAKKHKESVLYIGFDKCSLVDWDRSFYKQLNIDFIERYRYFKLPRTLPEQITTDLDRFIFVHNQSSDEKYELNIQSSLPKFIAKKQDTNNLLSYLNLFKRAEEIHCVNSAFFHLIDSLPDITNKLYYYDVRNHPYTFQVSKKWEIIK